MTSIQRPAPVTTLSDPADLVPGLSQAIGPTDVPLVDETIGRYLSRTVAAFPDHDALIDFYGDKHLTYQELHRKVLRLASGLHAAGYRKGDRIGVWSPNRWEWTVLQFAAAEIGLILVTLNPSYRTRELTYAMNQAGVTALFSAGRFKDSNYRAMVHTVEHEFPRDFRETVFFGSERWEELAGHPVSDLTEVREALDPHDPILIQYTSGTTGLAKGATLTHHNILNNALILGRRLGYSEADRVVIPVPFFHCSGMVIGVLGAVAVGATAIISGPGFTPASVLEAVSLGEATCLIGVPTMFLAILQTLDANPGKYRLDSLRTGLIAGTSVPTHLFRRIIDEMGMTEAGTVYGMTETSPVNHQSLPGDSVEKRVTTVGRVSDHTEVKIVDPRSGDTVPVGTQGEVLVRGYTVMSGYWDMPAKTEDTIEPDGWIHSGDLGVMDDEGYVQITGRSKDMVIRGGENIYPREIEEYLYTHPDIVDVQVIGVPDEKYGEELMAWIIMAEGAEPLDAAAVRAFCEGHLARFKIPKFIHLTDAFPMTVSGKVRKVEMREKAIGILGLYTGTTPAPGPTTTDRS
ncbi:AMP-binding protein [Corynebacterium terpenotabidum]|uniref:AMP-binding domain protein n=1 Tax=Corynebacterium terpenotabidum Y-11 TaxID=1200352 RepID=S4XDU5_9CORY|nr:AMP-binding protein [Corynebacterium terpenotabidum]AGP31322.1 AMP-binding domain protein [Corynebacterium terpenotabidum Y-11]